MQPSSSSYRNVPVLSKATAACRRAVHKDEPLEWTAAFEPGHPVEKATPDELLAAYPKVFGTVGAATAAPAGAISGAVSLGLLCAAVGTLLGPPGTAIGAVLGTIVGLTGGWWGGGMAGGAVGQAVGKGLQKLHVEPPFGHTAAQGTQGFSLGKLAHNLLKPTYSSEPKLTDATLDKVRSLLQPGDIILSARNSNAVTFEPVMAMAGVGGDWVHTGIYNGDGKVYEQHNSMEQKPHASRARLSSLDEFVKRSNHLMILRPPYANAQEVQDTLKASQERLGQHYDYTFNLQNPSKMYCVAYTYLAVEKGAPSIQLAEPDRALGHDVVSPKTFQKTPGMEPIYSTGASFPLTYLSKFD